jgi:hypothetical protein
MLFSGPEKKKKNQKKQHCKLQLEIAKVLNIFSTMARFYNPTVQSHSFKLESAIHLPRSEFLVLTIKFDAMEVRVTGLLVNG